MKNGFSSRVGLRLVTVLALSVTACSDSGEPDAGVSRAQVVADYATLVEANYAEALGEAEALRDALGDFTSEPSEETFTAAKAAWLASRTPYGQTEAFRFYQGPIDNDDDGPEGMINAWPIDESYIDYVAGPEDTVLVSGLVNLPDDYPDITEDVIAELNEKEGETNIMTGYHAIEFLLWGQDRSEDGPGERPYTDYVSGDEGTAENQDRRARYLLTAADLLLVNLNDVHEQWQADQANYRADFLALEPSKAIGNMLLGMGSLAGAELAGERMTVAYDNKDQENEHSCFSDNTKADLLNNAKSVQNVLLGNYQDLDGAGIDELVQAKDSALAERLREQIQTAIDDIDAIPGSFDTAILGDDESEGRVAVRAAIDSLLDFKDSLEEAAGVLDIPLELE
jgi:putative iron-regulated protein